MIIVVMGVAGCGKSTIAKTLARKLKIEFVDADSFHSQENIAKMSSGVSLSDEDRYPWLESLRTAISQWIKEERSVALACSALKAEYRRILNVDAEKLLFVYLKGNQRLFASRLARRKTHFMKENMLASQLETLEEPSEEEAMICDAGQPVINIVRSIIAGSKAGKSPDK
ncbi:MAG: gluconokinase [Candidatus Obscuribacterales bacterium]|nr:gluconokinase [Candidatus Obscuribacterales bacterium]